MIQNSRKTMGISVWCSPPLGTWVDHDNGWMWKYWNSLMTPTGGKSLGRQGQATASSRWLMWLGGHVGDELQPGKVQSYARGNSQPCIRGKGHRRGSYKKPQTLSAMPQSILAQLRRNRHTFLRLYKQYVRPHLDHTTTSHGRICYPSTWRTGYYFPSNK